MASVYAFAMSGMVACCSVGSVTSSNVDPNQLLAQMSLKQKIGQMTQMNIDQLTTYFNDLDPIKLTTVFDQYQIGNILNAITGCKPLANGDFESTTSLSQWQNLTAAIQAYAMAPAHTNITPAIPVSYGLDSVHGANFLDNAAWFPQNVGAAAAFNPGLTRQAAAVAALDTRSLGISWMFSPVLGLGMQPLWSRLYETPGEDPFVGAAFGTASVLGHADASVQIGYNASTVIGTLKHFFGYSAPRSGHDRTDAWIPDAYLKQYFQPSFEAAIRAGGKSVMINSASINGIPAHASKVLLTSILRQELGCVDCVALTDWQDIEKLHQYHNLASTPAEAIVLALDAGVDMSMVPFFDNPAGYPFFADVLLDLVTNGTVPESRIDQSVLRILQMKIEMGLFDNPTVPPQLANRTPGSPSDLALALDMARESLTLLQNRPIAVPASGGQQLPVLPLTWLPVGATILVVGPSSIDMTALCGGWSLGTLAGGNGKCGYPTIHGSSIYNATATIAANMSKGYTVVSMQGVTFTSSDAAHLAAVAAAAAAADVVVMAIGEAPEKETAGDIQDLTMSSAQLALFAALNGTSTPVVTVLVEPRPRILGPIADGSDGIIMAYLPCITGGQAIAETLFGINNPSGRLPITYPRTTGDLDVYWHKPWMNSQTYEGEPSPVYHDPLFDFGFGLSYSNITYSDLVLDPPSAPAGSAVNVSFTVHNAGPYDAKEASLLFVRQLYRQAITPENAMVKGFTKTAIAAGTSAQVSIVLNTSDLAYWTPSLDKQIDAGVYNVSVGGMTSQMAITQGGLSGTFEYRGPGRMELGPDQAPQIGTYRSGNSNANAEVLEGIEHASLRSEKSQHTSKLSAPVADRDALLSSLMDIIDDADVSMAGPLARSVKVAATRQRIEAALKAHGL